MDDVPLPHTRMTAWPHGWHYTYAEDQLRAYGAACAAAERARVIEECVALAAQHANAAKHTDNAASSVRLLVTRIRALVAKGEQA